MAEQMRNPKMPTSKTTPHARLGLLFYALVAWASFIFIVPKAGANAFADGSRMSVTDLDALEATVREAEDIQDIERLTFIFGYYRDKFFDDEALSLFSDNAVVNYANGKYVGKGSIRRLFLGNRFKLPEAVGKQGPQRGLLNDHILMMPVIDIAPGGQFAKARFKDWVFQGVSHKSQTMSSGLYEFEYAKQDGVWRISMMAYCTRFSHPYETNPRDIPLPERERPEPAFFPTDSDGPDKQTDYACPPWPHPSIAPPFHYPHPVTGDYIRRP